MLVMMIVGAAGSVYARNVVRPRHRVELLNDCSHLDDRSARENQPPVVNARNHDRPVASRFETRDHLDLVEVRWSSTFVAQILGQESLTKTTDARRAGRVYAEAGRDAPVKRLLRLA